MTESKVVNQLKDKTFLRRLTYAGLGRDNVRLERKEGPLTGRLQAPSRLSPDTRNVFSVVFTNIHTPHVCTIYTILVTILAIYP